MSLARLVLIRGAPGSGKTTFARNAFPRAELHESDAFFTSADGVYRFDPTRLAQAHNTCMAAVFAAVAAGRDVVVANTFTRLWELAPYLAFAEAMHITVEVYRCSGAFGSVHDVPRAVVDRMLQEYEPLTREKSVANYAEDV